MVSLPFVRPQTHSSHKLARHEPYIQPWPCSRAYGRAIVDPVAVRKSSFTRLCTSGSTSMVECSSTTAFRNSGGSLRISCRVAAKVVCWARTPQSGPCFAHRLGPPGLDSPPAAPQMRRVQL